MFTKLLLERCVNFLEKNRFIVSGGLYFLCLEFYVQIIFGFGFAKHYLKEKIIIYAIGVLLFLIHGFCKHRFFLEPCDKSQG